MTGLITQIINKYQGVASPRVISAVETAANKTGADFSFLMDKAATESGFNPAAKAKTSSATGLFQFIESTWLRMVKEYGPRHGLGALAGKIEEKDGRLCVDDCDAKAKILNLRKNPEIAALMAGEFSANNRDFLEAHTDGPVGATEMYLAHFMGANGAAKFLNSREENGDVAAFKIFPKEARANKNVFFDAGTGRPRTLDGVYDFFNDKFNNEAAPALASAAPPAERGLILTAPAQSALTLAALDVAQALPFFFASAGDTEQKEDSSYKSGFSKSLVADGHRIYAENAMAAAQMRHARIAGAIAA